MPAVARAGAVDIDDVDGRVVVLAGPGVIDADAVDGLRVFADAGDLGVANTWGAKGVFSWDSPHHLGTCGLQARDFELLGFGDASAIVTTGLDDAESPHDRFALAPVIDIEPADLGALAGRVRATSAPTNELYPRLAAVAQPGYTDEKVPLHPARAAADLGAVLPIGGLVVGEPGVAGLWLARTFPTPALAPGAPRRVVVPATRDAGISVRIAIDAARAGRPAVAVTTAADADAVHAALEAAAPHPLDIVIVVWDSTGRLADADDHRTRLERALTAPGTSTVHVPVDVGDTRQLIDAAGEVVAWGGINESEWSDA
jgi:thiamine pyrophosphate-dependent acetolactate synthase large subunit-like protein